MVLVEGQLDGREHPLTRRILLPAAKLRLPAFDSKLDRNGIELEAKLTAKYGIIDDVPSMDEMVREGASS